MGALLVLSAKTLCPVRSHSEVPGGHVFRGPHDTHRKDRHGGATGWRGCGGAPLTPPLLRADMGSRAGPAGQRPWALGTATGPGAGLWPRGARRALVEVLSVCAEGHLPLPWSTLGRRLGPRGRLCRHSGRTDLGMTLGSGDFHVLHHPCCHREHNLGLRMSRTQGNQPHCPSF